MSIPYLGGKQWSDWTRDERFFCSTLYHKAIEDTGRFAKWVCTTAELDVSPRGQWDVGFEVSFYRDFLWQRGIRPADYKVSDQRAFDLCLFGEHTIVVIEAKVFEAFKLQQNKEFAKDKQSIAALPGLGSVQVRLVALASRKYFANQAEHGRTSTLEMFDGRITWAQAEQEYGEELFGQAERTYKMKPAMRSLRGVV